MNLCFSTLGCVACGLSDVIRLAKGYSVTGLEFRGMNGVLDNGSIEEFSESRATETKNQLASAGLTPVVLGTSCSFHSPERERYDKAITEGKSAVDIAARIGISYIRVFGNKITEDREACFRRVDEGISALCDYAAGTPVSVLLETHGDYHCVETLQPLVDKLSKNDNFGLIWDVAHTHSVYGKDFVMFYRAMRPYIRHVHIKDFSSTHHKLVLPGDGDIPIRAIMEMLLSGGYEGYFSLEWEKKWHPELPDLPIALERFATLTQLLS